MFEAHIFSTIKSLSFRILLFCPFLISSKAMLLLLLCTTIALLSIVPLDAHPHFHTGQEIGTVWHATSDDSTPPPILSYHAHIVFNLNKHHYDRAMALRDRTIFQFQDYLMGEESQLVSTMETSAVSYWLVSANAIAALTLTFCLCFQ